MTLVELIVAMGIFTVIIAVFMAGVVVMTRDTARAQAVSDAGTEVQGIFQRFDRDVRYASAINLPWFGSGAGAGSYYVEYLVSAVEGGTAPQCTQWRYVPGTGGKNGVLQRRSWPDGSVPSPLPAWRTEASNVRNDLTQPAQRPFQMSVTLKQQLRVVLDVGPGPAGAQARKGAGLDAFFVARNTTDLTATRTDKNGDRLSDSPVCQGVGRS